MKNGWESRVQYMRAKNKKSPKRVYGRGERTKKGLICTVIVWGAVFSYEPRSEIEVRDWVSMTNSKGYLVD